MFVSYREFIIKRNNKRQLQKELDQCIDQEEFNRAHNTDQRTDNSEATTLKEESKERSVKF